jgi:biofilm PGA synthesis N-glycosyltransferase PgaC
MYIPIKLKYTAALVYATIWTIFSVWIALPWINQLSDFFTSAIIAWFIVGGIAVVPGFMSAFLVAALVMDRRPPRRLDITSYPDVSILIAAYNEGENIVSTLESIDKQDYPGNKTVYVINDGSTDDTAEKVRSVAHQYPWLKLIDLEQNAGKSNALNVALKKVKTNLTITVDGDSYLFRDALRNIVERYISDPDNTVAVAGCVLVRNSRKNIVTKVQEWDYFHGIAAIKRLQSLFQGTLVAQGAFSIYDTAVLRECGGWKPVVGEDIVLTWDILERGYRVGYAEDALLFTNAPDTWKQFFNQRRRWSRGLIEAFKSHWRMLFKPKMITLFVWWNLMFPWMDIVYTFAFIPGIIAALFGFYMLAGPMTLILLPMALVVNYLLFLIQTRMFDDMGLKVRKNPVGFLFYAFLYSLILQPACVVGYIHELFRGSKKNWGTK